jgi:hypothetical protein
VVCLAPRALREIVRPRRLSGVVVRPLNFTVRRLSSSEFISGVSFSVSWEWLLRCRLSFHLTPRSYPGRNLSPQALGTGLRS